MRVSLFGPDLFLAALIVAALLLTGCDGEYERLQAEAEWHAKVARAALPRDGELVTIKRLSEKSYAVRHYKGGLRHTDILVMEAE